MSIHWPELQGDFSFHIEGFCRGVLGVICLFPPPSTEPLTLVPSAWGSQWPPETSAWRPGSCDIKVTFTAFPWSPSLCACACSYQRHAPVQCTGRINAGVSKYLSTTVSFLQLLESVFPMLKAKCMYEAIFLFSYQMAVLQSSGAQFWTSVYS